MFNEIKIIVQLIKKMMIATILEDTINLNCEKKTLDFLLEQHT